MSAWILSSETLLRLGLIVHDAIEKVLSSETLDGRLKYTF